MRTLADFNFLHIELHENIKALLPSVTFIENYFKVVTFFNIIRMYK